MRWRWYAASRPSASDRSHRCRRPSSPGSRLPHHDRPHVDGGRSRPARRHPSPCRPAGLATLGRSFRRGRGHSWTHRVGGDGRAVAPRPRELSRAELGNSGRALGSRRTLRDPAPAARPLHLSGQQERLRLARLWPASAVPERPPKSNSAAGQVSTTRRSRCPAEPYRRPGIERSGRTRAGDCRVGGLSPSLSDGRREVARRGDSPRPTISASRVSGLPPGTYLVGTLGDNRGGRIGRRGGAHPRHALLTPPPRISPRAGPSRCVGTGGRERRHRDGR